MVEIQVTLYSSSTWDGQQWPRKLLTETGQDTNKNNCRFRYDCLSLQQIKEILKEIHNSLSPGPIKNIYSQTTEPEADTVSLTVQQNCIVSKKTYCWMLALIFYRYGGSYVNTGRMQKSGTSFSMNVNSVHIAKSKHKRPPQSSDHNLLVHIKNMVEWE